MKKTYAIFLIMIMSIGFAPQTFASSNSIADPFASDSEISFNVMGQLSYDYCNDIAWIYANVESSTNTVPDQVIGQINDTNYTLTAPLFLPTGMLNNKQFKQGIIYVKNVGTLAPGQYNLTIHAIKGTQTFSSSVIPVIINSTLYIDNGFAFDDLIRLDHYKYLFTLETYNIESKCISSVIVTINGTNYTMIRDEVFHYANQDLETDGILAESFFSQFFYIHEFPKVQTNQQIQYNFTIVFSDQTKFVSGDSIKIFKETEVSTLTPNIADYRYELDGIYLTLRPFYFDGMNRPLQGLILNLNGTNITLDHQPHMAEFMDTIVNIFRKPVYAFYDDFDDPMGERIKDYVFKVEYGKYYNVSIWYNNGSWINVPVFDLMIPSQSTDITEPVIEYQNLESRINGTHCWVSGKIKVTSYWPGFNIAGSSFMISITTGEIRTATMATQTDPSDTNYADGKFFQFNETLWTRGNPYWGNIILNYSFYYGNASIGYGYEFNRYFGSTTIERVTPEMAGSYILPGKPLIYKVYEKQKSCCGTLTLKNQTEIYNMVAFEKAFRGDRIVFNKTYIFDSVGMNRYNINATVVNASKQLIISGGASLYLGDPVIATNALSALGDSVNSFPIDTATKAKISKDFLTSLTTVYYEEKFGDITVKIKFVYDEKGVLRLGSLQQVLRETIIHEIVMELQLSAMDMIMEDYLLVIIVGAVALVGIVVITRVIIKKRKAKSKN